MVPLSAFASFGPGTTPLAVNHQGVFVATTFSFNLPPGVSMGRALTAIQNTMNQIDVPISVHGETAGTAQVFQKSFSNMPFLLLAAILTIYITLGVLYESLIHPVTILSTWPSAGVGAVLAILIFHRIDGRTQFDLIAMIGVILLIGIVKKNAIIMIDFAIDLERREGLTPRDAIYKACLLRFRPIMMTTTGAILGALPLAIGLGEGSELRQPLGISVVGGLFLSQILTLYTTPVVFLYMDRFGDWTSGFWNRWYHGIMGDKPEDHQPRRCRHLLNDIAIIAAGRTPLSEAGPNTPGRLFVAPALLLLIWRCGSGDTGCGRRIEIDDERSILSTASRARWRPGCRCRSVPSSRVRHEATG